MGVGGEGQVMLTGMPIGPVIDQLSPSGSVAAR